jgi:hypothetical protein
MTTSTKGENTWEVSVIVDSGIGEGVSASQSFHAEMQPAAIVASIEARPVGTTKESITAVLDSLMSVQPDIVPFIEVVPSDPFEAHIDAVARALSDVGHVGGLAIRCGGTAASMVPDSTAVASFILAATNAKLPFKATVGLDQPIRHYDTALDTWRHGFVNVLVAAAAADAGFGVEVLASIIADTDSESFTISAAFITWRELSIPGPAMRRVRTRGFVASGSCNFFQAVETLKGLSFLGEST